MSFAPNPPPAHTSRLSVPSVRAAKNTRKLVVLTAYTSRMAELLDAHCDMLMVGDSLGMVVYGMDSTLPVNIDLMENHAAAVVRGSSRALVVVDLPFGSYEASPAQAFKTAARLLKHSGAHAVKLEGGVAMHDTIRFLSARGIPVMGHVGLMPQHMHQLGGFKAQGKDEAAAHAILADAEAVESAGAFAVVLEGIMAPLAETITRHVRIPTIGIGASAECDGQVLVVDDMLGMFEKSPRFVKQYASLRDIISEAAHAYADDVRTGRFPTDAQCYGVTTSAASKSKTKKA